MDSLTHMNKKVLLISRDAILLATREAIFRSAGYLVACASNTSMGLEIALDVSPDLVILGHTIMPDEQISFIDELHETRPEIHVLRLRTGIIQPDLLLKGCAALLSGKTGGTRVHIADNVQFSSGQ